MNKNTLFFFVIFSFLIAGCHWGEPVITNLHGPENYISFSVKTEPMAPRMIIGDRSGKTGAVFYETANGKTWLKGKPTKVSQSANRYLATWQDSSRTVTVTITTQPHLHKFSFEAKPDSDILKWGMNIAASDTEYFTGLFERTVDGKQDNSWKKGIQQGMNLRGQEVDMLIKPTLSLYCPFYLSSAGYGLSINGTWPGHYDLCKSDPHMVKIVFEGPDLTGSIYYSSHPGEIVGDHALQTGPSLVPPEWAFLPWRWRDNHTNLKKYYDGTPVHAPYNSMVVEDILMMRALGIPCGAYWVDRPWAKGPMGYNDFDWDRTRFPHPDKMIEWIHKNNIKFLLWIAPWVAGNMRNEAISKGYTIPMKSANHGVDSSNAALLDFTNPAACKWWQKNGIEKMLKQGVNGFKLDRSEEVVPETRDIIFHNGKTAREMRNEYPVLYAKTVNESCKKIYGDDFVTFQRAGYTGSSKYTCFWGGDIASQPEGLRAAIIAVQRSAINGFPIWGSDIGGYWQGELDREVCARWLAFGCFTPIMEFGPTEDHAPWDMLKEPHYDKELIAIWRMYAILHTKLADYTRVQAENANKTGIPIVRPLFLEYPDSKEAWENWQTYQYGPDILVTAIWQKGDTITTCHLPAGNNWRDAWDTARLYHGGETVTVNTPMYKIPIFIRDHSQVSLGDLNKLYKESLDAAAKKPDLKALEKTIQ